VRNIKTNRGLVIEEDNRVCIPTCSGRSSLANGFFAGFAKAEQRGECGPKSIVLSLYNELRYRGVRQWPMISESHRTGSAMVRENNLIGTWQMAHWSITKILKDMGKSAVVLAF